MKIKLLLLLLATTAIFSHSANAQGIWTGAAAATSWSYNPGTATADSRSAAVTAQEFLSPIFLANPSSGNARLFLFGNATPGGGVTIQNNKFTMVANHTGGAHKVSVYNIDNPYPVTSMFFTLNVSSVPTNGLIILGLGNSSGAIYTNIAQLSGSDQPGLFTAIQFSIGSSAITARFRGTTSPTHTYSSFSPTIAKGIDLPIELYCNNSTAAQTYTRASVLYTVPSGAFHIYVDGTALTSGGSANIPYAAEVAKGQAINAFTFNGSDSSSPSLNALSFTVSDIKLGHNETVLPVTLTDFSAKQQGSSVKLDWSTESSQNNQYFELFRKNTEEQFVSIAKINGGGDSQSLQKYSYTDFNPSAGANYYKLVQVDNDGKVNGPWYAGAKMTVKNESLKAFVNGQQQLQLAYQAESKAEAKVTVSDLNGKKILAKQLWLEKENNNITLDLSTVAKGIYIVTLVESGHQNTAKILVK